MSARSCSRSTCTSRSTARIRHARFRSYRPGGGSSSCQSRGSRRTCTTRDYRRVKSCTALDFGDLLLTRSAVVQAVLNDGIDVGTSWARLI